MSALLASLLLELGGRGAGPVPYHAWSSPIKAGTCSGSATPLPVTPTPHGQQQGSAAAAGAAAGGAVTCTLEDGVKVYRFPAGIFEIDEQLLVPERTTIAGAADPNDMQRPTESPDWQRQTLFLATRGASNYSMNYCHAKDMITTRVGFVLSSQVTVRNVSYQGIDTIRPGQNGALCGGGAFETKGCAENDCKK